MVWIHLFATSQSQTPSLLLDFSLENIQRIHKAPQTHAGALSETWPPQPHYRIFKVWAADSILIAILYLPGLFLSSDLYRNRNQNCWRGFRRNQTFPQQAKSIRSKQTHTEVSININQLHPGASVWGLNVKTLQTTFDCFLKTSILCLLSWFSF